MSSGESGTAVGLAPLSFPQEQLWLMENLAPGTYNEIWVLRIEGDLDVGLLERCLDLIVERHEVLRSTFDEVDGEPVCRPLPHLSISLGTPMDISYVPAPLRAQVVADLAALVADPPYDLARGPLVRTALARLGAQEHLLMIATHHIVADGWSLRVVLRELLTAYGDLAAGAPVSLPDLPRQYRDFAVSQRAQQAGDELAEEERYWRGQLHDAVPVLELRSGSLRAPVKAIHGRRIRIDFPSGLGRRLSRFAMSERSTAASVVLAAFAAVVHRYTGREDFLIGTASDARPEEELEPLVGFFANTVPLRLRPRPKQTFADLLRHVMEVSLDALDHSRLPFARIVDMMRPDRDPSHNPLVQVVFSHAEIGDADMRGAGLHISYEHVPRTRSRFDLIVEAQTGLDDLRFWVEFDDALLPEQYIRQLFEHLRILLTAVLEAPDLPLVDVPMLTVAERTQGIFEVPPQGAPTPTRELVVVGADALAPRQVPGRIVSVNPQHIRLVADRVAVLEDARLADTGDLGYIDDHGTIVRLGPGERFPSLNGLTVPLDQVAATLAVHPDVRTASVDLAGSPPVLSASVVPATRRGPMASALRDYLGGRVPRYAVPAEIVVQPRFGGSDEDVAPEHRPSPIEDVVHAAWQYAIDVDHIGLDDDFFAIGGHSILAAGIVLRLRQDLGLRVPIRWIFECPTVRRLAARIAKEHPGAGPVAVGAAELVAVRQESAPAGQPIPLTIAQSQIWVLDRLAPGRATYHSPLRIDIAGPLDPEALREAFAAVVHRHDVLRSVIRFEGDRPMQVAQPIGPQLALMDLGGLPAEQRRVEIERLAHEQAHRPFDLAKEHGIRALLIVDHHELRHVLLLTVHHIVMDGVGYDNFCREVSACYNAAVSGAGPCLAEPTMSWSDYARWEEEWLAGPEPTVLWAYWERALADLPVVRFPTPLARPPLPTFDGDQQSVVLDAAATGTVFELARQYQVSPFIAVTAAQALLVHRLTGASDIPIGAAGENRRLPGAEKLIGCTIGTLVLRVDCGGDPTFHELLSRVRSTVLDAYAHQGLPFSQLVRAAAMPRLIDRLPLFQIATDWHEPERTGWDLAGCDTTWRFTRLDTARNDLYFTAAPRGGELVLSLEYNTGVWTADSAGRLLTALRAGLTAAAEQPHLRLSELPLPLAGLAV